MLQTQGAISAPAGRSMRPSSPDKPQKTDFLVSFLVDARGGSMTGARRSDGLYIYLISIYLYLHNINLHLC